MNAPTKKLLWSEWRQRRIQFLLSTLWLVIGTTYCIVSELATGMRSPVGDFFSTTMLFSLGMPIFLAMRTSLGEFTDRTRAFHDSLPVSTNTRAIIRLGGGIAVLVASIVFSGILLSTCLAMGWLEQALERPSDYWHTMIRLPDRPSQSALAATFMVWRVAAIAVASASMLYLLLSLLGTFLRNESSLGFAGAAVAAVWFLGTGWATHQLDGNVAESGVFGIKEAMWIGALLPQSLSLGYSYEAKHGSYQDLVFSSRLVAPLLANLVVQLGLAAVFVHRYGRRISHCVTGGGRTSTPEVWFRRPMPLATPGIALSWLTLRQCIPMCIPGLVIAFVMAPLQIDVADFDPDTSYLRKMTDILPSSMWVVGLLWSIVVGAGIFAPELDARIAEFWRAWPTGTLRLFAVKFVIGLAAVLLVLDGTTIALSWNSPHWGRYYFMNWPYIVCIVPFHATMFAVAVACTCLVRRPVVGGMLAFATFMLTFIVTDWSDATRQFHPIEVYNNLNERNCDINVQLGMVDFSAHHYPVVAAAMAFLIFGMAFIGWWALRSYAPRRAVAL